ncbi:MAG: hypothetical protein OWT27_05350, partial [Firmicutes bacterium]|nr:hypothetical protein [Bacillota bacterium]
YLGADASATGDRYRVSLQMTQKPVNLSSSAQQGTSNTRDAYAVGGFSGQKFASAALADGQVAALLGTSAFAKQSGTAKTASIYLGHSVIGSYNVKTSMDMIEWKEGDWTFAVMGSNVQTDKSVAISMVTWLHARPLPAVDGFVSVVDDADVQHAVATYAVGSDVYSDWDDHHALSALAMVASMQPYKGIALPPVPKAVAAWMANIDGQTAIPLQVVRYFDYGPAQERGLTASGPATYGHYAVQVMRGTREVACFGGQGYVRKPTARIALQRMAAVPDYGDLRSKPVDLGHGIVGKVYNQVGLVRWHEGLWTFSVQAGTTRSDVGLATNMVTFVHSHMLPPTIGYVTVKNTPVAQYSYVYWVYGDDMYVAYSPESAIQALWMGVSSVPWCAGCAQPAAAPSA